MKTCVCSFTKITCSCLLTFWPSQVEPLGERWLRRIKKNCRKGLLGAGGGCHLARILLLFLYLTYWELLYRKCSCAVSTVEVTLFNSKICPYANNWCWDLVLNRVEEWQKRKMGECWTTLYGCMMEGNGTEDPCSRTLGWLRQNNDAKPWLWKFSNCFSRPEHTLPLSPHTVTMCKTEDIANSLCK